MTAFAPPPAPDRSRRTARLMLALALTLFALFIAASFLPALVWAAVIAIAVDPLHLRLRARFPGWTARVLIAVLITVVVALVVLIPIAIGLTRAAHEAHELAIWAANAQRHGVPVPAWIDHLPAGNLTAREWWQQNLATPEGAAEQFRVLRQSSWLTHSRLIGSSLVHRSVIFAFTLIALFFLLRDRDVITDQCRRASDRVFGPAGERIGRQAIRSVRGTIDGLVLVGIGEGAVMAIVYLALGVPHPLLFGAVTAVAAMIPFGAALVFGIAALLLVGQGALVGATVVVVVGLLVVAIADHFIRPALIGGATRLPFLWVLIGILGGVEMLGLLGLFVGPATMAVLVLMWREFLDGQGGDAA